VLIADLETFWPTRRRNDFDQSSPGTSVVPWPIAAAHGPPAGIAVPDPPGAQRVRPWIPELPWPPSPTAHRPGRPACSNRSGPGAGPSSSRRGVAGPR